ncbi:MAG: archease [Myxococcales bacterium]|nr:archease [Myxococcales bacterium]
MTAAFYRQLDHTGDCAIEVVGTSRAELYRHCALAFYDLVIGLSRIDGLRETPIEVAGADDAALLFNLYDELIFRFDVDGLVASRIEVVVCEAHRLVLHAFGESWRREKHDYQVAVKAPTYHQMCFVEEKRDLWRARVVFDL